MGTFGIASTDNIGCILYQNIYCGNSLESLQLKTKDKLHQNINCGNFCYLQFVLRFYGPVNPMGSCPAWSPADNANIGYILHQNIHSGNFFNSSADSGGEIY